MAILVTGGAGYIGSHTCVELLEKGYEVVVVDSFINSRRESLKRVSEITGRELVCHEVDLLDRRGMERVFLEHDIEAVIHFAALKAVGESVSMPLQYYLNNITGTLILCELMKEHGVKKLVFSSSATVYGMAAEMPVSEGASLSATNPYGRSKQMMEEILKDLHQSDPEWSIALLRYFNPIGAHPSGLIGEEPSGIPNNLMPFIAGVASGKLPQLNIFGGDYPTADGTGVRDYIHVVDLAQGHIKAVEKLSLETGVNAYNLGTGMGYSVLEMVSAFERASGQKIPYTIVERRPGDIAECYANPLKAKIELGWEAVKGMEEMCVDAWRWQVQNRQDQAAETAPVSGSLS
ncbi:UDP-glucose 4-epimerase GalE [Peribacillus sp. SCS-37]|uniref:UDP-glucose 4-epimerase GalE n=1 Tax=Paraperibacillus esterisolvens TaxID=3115296 RepID=UPI0039069BC3